MKNLKEIKNKTLLRLAELKNQKEQVSKELVLWKAKEHKAKKFSQVLYETRGFAADHLDYNIEEAQKKAKQCLLENSDSDFGISLLKHEIKNEVKFFLYYQGLELFKKKIVEDIEYRTKDLEIKLGGIDNEIEKLEKRSQQQALRKPRPTVSLK